MTTSSSVSLRAEAWDALAQKGIWFSDDSPVQGPDGRRIDLVATGMHAGTRHNSHQALFTPEAVMAAIARLNGSLPGRDGHVAGSAIGDPVTFWHRVEMGSAQEHPEGGETHPVYFFGVFAVPDPDEDLAELPGVRRIKRAIRNQVSLYSSVVVLPLPEGLSWRDEGPTFERFDFKALDVALQPSDPYARVTVQDRQFNSTICFAVDLSLKRPDTSSGHRQTEGSMNPKQSKPDTGHPGTDPAIATDPPVPETVPPVVGPSEMAAMEQRMADMEQRNARAEQQSADRDSLDTVLEGLAELPNDLRFDADRAIRQEFRKLRNDRAGDQAMTLAQLAYETAVKPFRTQLADRLLEEAKQAQADPDGKTDDDGIALDGSVVSMGSVFEAETGRPDYERPMVDMLSLWEQTGRNRERIRGEIGSHHLPSNFNYKEAPVHGMHWEATRRMLDQMADAPLDPDPNRRNSPTLRDALIVETRIWDEVDGDRNAFMRRLSEHARNHPGMWQFATLGSDFVNPRSVDMMPINALLPMLPPMGLFDTRVVNQTKITLTEETRHPVESKAFTATLTGTLNAGETVDIGKKHIDPDATFTMGTLVEGTDYAIEHTRGIIHNIKGSTITLANITAAKYFPYTEGEGVTPAESKTQTQSHTEDTWWDRVRVTYTREAEIEPLMNAGYPTATRLQFMGLFDIREMIARSLAHTAWTALRWINARLFKTGSTGLTIDATAYKKFGEMKSERLDAGYSPTVGLMSHTTADQFTNLTDYFSEDAIASAAVNASNVITVLKGLPIVPMRYWKHKSTELPYIAIGQPPFARYCVLAQNGLQVGDIQSMFDTNGNIVDGRQFIIRINHYIGSFYKNEHNAVLVAGT